MSNIVVWTHMEFPKILERPVDNHFSLIRPQHRKHEHLWIQLNTVRGISDIFK